MNIVILGLSITSSWGNGHATTYRALVRALAARGHRVLFLERDVPWYRSHRDLPEPPYGTTRLYASLEELHSQFDNEIRAADLVVVGSYVPDGVAVSEWVIDEARGITAFYDIDTPITLAALERGDCQYLAPHLIPRFHIYLTFSGGPVLSRIERHYGSPMTRPLYCSVDPDLYYPEQHPLRWDLGYLGTYSADRQPALERLLLEPARQVYSRSIGSKAMRPDAQGLPRADLGFVVAGSQFPPSIAWPENVERIEHLPPGQHRSFYNAQRFTLNITRAQMIRAGHSPSVRLFEAAACGVPVVTDEWEGLDSFFEPGAEILVARGSEDVLNLLADVPEAERLAMGRAARNRILSGHTADHRAAELEACLCELRR